MARDTELDRLKSTMNKAYSRKQAAYEAMQDAWNRRGAARDRMNQAYEAKGAARKSQDSTWEDYRRIKSLNDPRIDALYEQ